MTIEAELGSRLCRPRPDDAVYQARHVCTGCPAIDETALGGGFRCGEITALAGAKGLGKTLITWHILFLYLHTHPRAVAALVDTGSFSPFRVQEVFVHRLHNIQQSNSPAEHHLGRSTHLAEQDPRISLKEQAAALMDRVRVMRVFDLAGVAEAVSEISDLTQRQESPRQADRSPTPAASTDGNLEPNKASKTTQSHEQEASPDFSSEIGIRLLVIDNLASVAASELNTNHVQGSAFLTSCLRSIRELTVLHSLCTIIVNAAVQLNKSDTSNTHMQSAETDVSLFACSTGKPALHRTLAYLVDRSLFVSQVPYSREDAEAAYAGNADQRRYCHYTRVLEVLSDKHGDTEGHWGAFDIANDVELMGR